MSVELKIKSKHLSEEARIIRFEEHKVKKQMNWHKDRQQPFETEASLYRSLNTHRRWDVRNENRATFLARAYLAGKEYKTIENKCHDPMVLRAYILPRVCEMVNKYGPAADKLNKKWNIERKRYEYDPEPWKAHCDKVKAWTES